MVVPAKAATLPRPTTLPRHLLTIYTDYADKGVTQYVDADTNRVVAKLVARPKGQAATGSTGTPPSATQRCGNSGSYNYFDSGVWRPWRMTSTYHFNSSGAPTAMVSSWRGMLQGAESEWEYTRNLCGLSDFIIWHMTIGGDTAVSPTTDCGDPDGTNLVGFADFGGWTSDGLVLARTCNWSGDYIYESDVTFNNDGDVLWANGAYAGHWDMQSVAAHEFGHSLGLGHVQNDATYSTALAVMHPVVYRNDTRDRTLSRGDAEGAWHLYPQQYGYRLISARIQNPAGDAALEPGRTYTATVDVQNTGYQAWWLYGSSAPTLYTAPAGRCSAFAGADWPSCSTVSAIDEDATDAHDMTENDASVIAQGEIARYSFQIPADFAKEGVSSREWFRVHGLPIADASVPIDVNVGTYRATVVSQTGPGIPDGFVVRGVPAGAAVTLRNDGTAPWILGDNRIRLVTDPAGRCSGFASGWASCQLAAVLQGDTIVMPGDEATLNFTITAPFTLDTTFGLSHSERFDVEVAGRPTPRLGARTDFPFQVY